MTIIRVRSTLSETETDMNGRMNLTLPHTQDMVMIIAKPNAMIVMKSAYDIAAGLWRTHIRTQSAKIQEERESDDPELPAVYDVTTIELESVLDT